MSSVININSEIQMGFLDYPSAVDHSVNVFMYGCSNHCSGCSNPQFWSTKFGITVTVDELFQKICEASKKFRTNKICLLGGDPLFRKNRDFTRELVLLLSENNYDVCLFTGNPVSTVRRLKISGFKFVKTGKYEPRLECKSEKVDDYIQFASSNQELYDGDLNLLSKNGRYYFNNK